MYERAKAHYDKVFAETAQFEVEQNGISQKVQKTAIDNAEKLVIIALQKNDKGETIRTEEQANNMIMKAREHWFADEETATV